MNPDPGKVTDTQQRTPDRPPAGENTASDNISSTKYYRVNLTQLSALVKQKSNSAHPHYTSHNNMARGDVIRCKSGESDEGLSEMRLDLNKRRRRPGGRTWMLFEQIGGGCIMMRHLVSLLFRFMGSEACYDHYGARERGRETGSRRRGLREEPGAAEVFFLGTQHFSTINPPSSPPCLCNGILLTGDSL